MSTPMRNNQPGEHRRIVQELTASGPVRFRSGMLLLNHATVAIATTKEAPEQGDEIIITNNSASGTAAHNVTLPTGVTWNGTNRTVTLDAPGELLWAVAESKTRFRIIASNGTLAFSN